MILKSLSPFSLLLSFSLSLFGQIALAGDCSTKDMSAELGTVRSQGNIGWCYANTAADLISYKFRKKWNGTQASAIFIALGYNYKMNSSEPGSYIFTEGGDIRAAINYAAEFGYSCPRPLDNLFVLGGFNLQIKQKLHIAEKLKSLFDNRLTSSEGWKAYRDYIYDLQQKQSIVSRISEEALENALRLNINLAVVEIAKEVCKPYKDQMPMSLVKSDIGRHFDSDTEYYDDVLKMRIKQKPDLMNLIDQQISADNVVGIDYAIKLISPDLKDSDSHASVVVGREMRNGQCYYKIRNSWGPECEYEGDNGKMKSRYNNKVECVDGHVWVKAADLKANLSSIAYIKTQSGL